MAITLWISILAGAWIVSSILSYLRERPLNWSFEVPPTAPIKGAPKFDTIFEYVPASGIAHAPSFVETPTGIELFWFEGSREAKPDIEIFKAPLGTPGCWRAGSAVCTISSPDLSDVFSPSQLVVTLGNLIENMNKRGSLFVTVVSLGGWAMASVADVGLTGGRASSAHKLNLSPFLNRSSLVRSPMVAMKDETFGLASYHEMGRAFGHFARLDANGRVVDLRRMDGAGLNPIQPMIVPLDANNAVAFLRNFASIDNLLMSRTNDGGQNWSAVQKTEIPNPSAPMAALRLADGRLLIAMNNDLKKPNNLVLSISDDNGSNWREIYRIDAKSGNTRYPMIRRFGDDILLTYSFNGKKGLRVHRFNDAWVDAQ